MHHFGTTTRASLVPQIRGRATIPSERDDYSAQNELENSAEIGWFQITAHDDHGGIPTGVVGVPDQQSVHCPVKKMHIEIRIILSIDCEDAQ